MALCLAWACSAPSFGAAPATAAEHRVEALRGLKFLKPVHYVKLDGTQLRAALERLLDERYSPEDFNRIQTSLAALGLLESGYALRAQFLDLMQEQVAAFYDHRKHTLNIVNETFSPEPVLAHELVHALQDQHFDLQSLGFEDKENDDRALAIAALIEGDATMVMSEVPFETTSMKAKGLSAPSSRLDSAPRYLRETLLFPYLKGLQFCLALKKNRVALSEVFRRPPQSTSQILHPEKYMADERPSEVALGEGLHGEEPFYTNVMGEFVTGLLLSQGCGQAEAERAAAGWRGDRYGLYEKGTALVWKSLWANHGEAEEFAAAVSRCWSRRNRKHWLVRSLKSTVILIDCDSEMTKEAMFRHYFLSGKP